MTRKGAKAETPGPGTAEDLVSRLRAGERLALSRTITALETESALARGLVRALRPHLGRCLVVGFTGPPGVGKSTLVNAYIGALRKAGKRVGVIAVDPSSPITGGAILGDRLRMTDHGLDEQVFIRSMASRGQMGGLSPSASRVVDAMDAAGKDVVIIETVGTGQSEVEVAEVADVKVVVLAPGLGDDVQAMKAGILEIADLLVVNKADLPQAQTAVAQLKSSLALRATAVHDAPVLETVATTGGGVDALAAGIEARAAALSQGDRQALRRARLRRLLVQAAAKRLDRTATAADGVAMAELCDAVADGSLDLDTAARRLLRESAGDDG